MSIVWMSNPRESFAEQVRQISWFWRVMGWLWRLTW
jgi:hypothetical protein